MDSPLLSAARCHEDVKQRAVQAHTRSQLAFVKHAMHCSVTCYCLLCHCVHTDVDQAHVTRGNTLHRHKESDCKYQEHVSLRTGRPNVGICNVARASMRHPTGLKLYSMLINM